MRVLSHLRTELGVQVSVADFFYEPTVAALARLIREAGNGS
ncbi:hypothetical protein BH24PSE2_BH24PSE2_21710 [soil metagenome]